MKRFFLAAISVGALALLMLPQSAQATVTGFVAGRIIDDGVFTDTSTMSASDIQRFLESKVPTCDTWGTQMYNSTLTRAQFAATLSNPQYPPFTCMKDYIENGTTAAQIIYNVAQQYQINPQVLIVLLQKEQGLITDSWPYASQYLKATGYGCPDTGTCNTLYYGFTNQLTRAANMYRSILNASPTWYTPYVLGNNYILYNPNTACGGSVVNIQNRATQALYNYTPYQPNQATLDADWGTAPCGAYGNRNFYLYFTSWFGSTWTPDYSWQLINQYVYTDSTKSTAADLNNLLPGERRYVGFTLKNTGSVTWTNSGANPLTLGASNPYERQSKFYDSTWPSATRPAVLKEASVAPGETGTFEFWMTVPYVTSTTTYNEYFTPLVEGKTWLANIGLFYRVTVEKPRYTWSLSSQYAFTDETKATPLNMGSSLPGQRVYVGFTAKNTGNMTWKNSGINALMAGTLSPYERQSKFSTGSNWLTGTRPTLMKESSVAPGETGTFEFWLTIPNSGVSGVYNERFGLIANNLTWLNDTGLSYYMNIQPARYTWSLSSQYAYTDSTKSTPLNMNALLPGQRVYIGFTAKNTGNMTWKNSGGNALMAGTLSPYERQSKFYDSTWPSATRPAVLKEASVAPGETGTFEFWMTVPSSGVSGVYNERFGLIANDLTWLNDTGLSYYMNVR